MLAFALLALAAAAGCAPGQLVANMDCCGGAAGSIYGHIAFRNVSPDRCVLEGVPSIEARDKAGKRVRTVVERYMEDGEGPFQGSPTLPLDPGATGEMTVQTVNANFDENLCAQLLIVNANGVVIRAAQTACGDARQGRVRVTVSGYRPARPPAENH